MSVQNTIRLSLNLPPEEHEIVVALLSDIGFFAFEEKSESLDAYIREADYSPEWHTALPEGLLKPEEATLETIPDQDWNAQWESGMQPVVIGDILEIYPRTQLPSGRTRYTIQIVPKMSFGTGHHETTRLMVEHCASIDFNGRQVLDMGTGTGVLGILACKMGASGVTGVDNDPWSFENATENAEANGAAQMKIMMGTAEDISGPCYDILLANINRNIIITSRDKYRELLREGGILVLSGFLSYDRERVHQHFSEAGFELLSGKENSPWVSLMYRKK